MDYLYSELNSSLPTTNTLEWVTYTTLPTAGSTNYMTIAVIPSDAKGDTVYICIKNPSTATGYEWKLLMSATPALPQLDTPVIELNNKLLSWSGIDNAVSYTIYSNGVVLDSGITTTTYDLSTKLTDPGSYSIKIKAIGDGSSYTDSEFSNIVVYTLTFKMYWGAEFEITTPEITTNFTEEECPTNLKSAGAVHYFTTKEEGEKRGKHCIYAYPAYYGNLLHIYCNDMTQFDLIDQWTKATVTYNGMEYNFYYANAATKDENNKYQYLFVLE